jgi:hypothetical protein
MTTSDPILFPIPIGNVESRRQAVTRARADLVTTLEALSQRVDPRRALQRPALQKQAGGAWQAALPVLGACAAAAVALMAVRRPWGGRAPLTAERSGKAAAGAVVLAAGAATYAALGRRDDLRTPTTTEPPTADSSSTKSLTGKSPAGRSRTAGGPTTAAIAVRSNVELGPGPDGGDVVDVLLAQHRRVDGFFDQVEATPGAHKLDAFAMLVDFLKRHEGAEQQIVHPVLRALGDRYADVVDARREEEKNADRLIASLISRGVTDPGFEAGLAELRDMVHAHAAHEEAEEFPLLRALVPARQLQSMAKRVRAAQVPVPG